jgi:serine/threonine protein kinase
LAKAVGVLVDRILEQFSWFVSGAYGTVFKAKDVADPSKYVALKKVKIPLNEDGIPVSILREISLVKQLDRFQHPNVVRFLDVCHGPRIMDNSSLILYLVFEFVDRDLAKYIREARTEDLSPGKIKVQKQY